MSRRLPSCSSRTRRWRDGFSQSIPSRSASLSREQSRPDADPAASAWRAWRLSLVAGASGLAFGHSGCPAGSGTVGFPGSGCSFRIASCWPQFLIGGDWCGVEEIHGPLEPRVNDAVPFSNDGETLFEAVQSTVIDFDGRTRACSTVCDLSRFVVAHGGIFHSRDNLFDQLGSFEDTWKGRAFETAIRRPP